MTNAPAASLRDRLARRLTKPGWQLALILAVCACIFWPMLGSSGFAWTEGHRVIPGWEMLERHDWYPATMFGQTYLRKPPGMPWAVALSAMLFGESEWSARAVSALASTLSAVLAWYFGRRWFGTWGGLGAGLAQALCPVWWPPGRGAEIEALNNFGVAMATLPLLDSLIGAHGAKGLKGVRLVLLGALGVIIAVLAKGPGVFPCVAAVIVAACVVRRSARVLLNGVLALYLLSGAAVLGVIAYFAWNQVKPEGAVTQSVTAFMWQEKRIWQIAALAPVALASAIPASFAVLFPWGPDAAKEQIEPRSLLVAKALAIACLVSLITLTVLGIDNPRYAWPALTLLMPLAGYVVAGVYGTFTHSRRLIACIMTAGGPLVAATILFVAGLAYVPLSEARREKVSGRQAGEAIGELLPDGADLWADNAVEARPEVPLYAQRHAAELGKDVRVLWIRSGTGPLPERSSRPVYLLLREDAEDMEVRRYEEAGFRSRLAAVGEQTKTHRYVFRLFQLLDQ